MKLHHISVFCFLLINACSINSFGQTGKKSTNGLKVVSTVPVRYRVKKSDGIHAYDKKGHNLTIYGDTSAIGFRADCDMDVDWTGAKAKGPTQSINRFESLYKCAFNPYQLYGTVLPGNAIGQHQFDGYTGVGAGVGDLTITYRVDKNGKTINTVIGVVFDTGPNSQPGESSVATFKKLQGNMDKSYYIYIVFPNSAKYLTQIIGTKASSDSLQRSPTNADFEQAFSLMNSQTSAKARKSTKRILLSVLSRLPVIPNFDNGTPQETARGAQQPGNDTRNDND
jgi:hypothetical protein